MNKYEVLYILVSGLDEAQYEALSQKYSEAVKEGSGEVESVNKWGIKKFAYPIDFKNEGYYILMTFLSDPQFPHELERRMRIDENIVRFMLTAK